ncbi:MAG: hypothetical protein P8P74_08860 [Crocinitomicaceae bacterium]|nr:hypothetical protein [Crocinitomicaceae bacterium]
MENSFTEKSEGTEKKTKFQSPKPILVRIRNIVFGKRKPDIFTRVTFYINTVLWLSFMLWNVIGYFAISSRKMISEMKNIEVEEIIAARGVELGFEPGDFITRLTVVYGVGILCWAAVFFGLILLYRKRKQFIYFVLGGVLFYVGLNIFYLSFQFFREDTTSFDKISLLVIALSTIIHSFLMNNERHGGSISFFGEADEEDV